MIRLFLGILCMTKEGLAGGATFLVANFEKQFRVRRREGLGKSQYLMLPA